MPCSYGVVAAYCLADTLAKAWAAAAAQHRGAAARPAAAAEERRVSGLPALAAGSAREAGVAGGPVAAAVAESLLFHGAASLALPAVAINRTVWCAGRALAAWPRAPALLRRAGPSALGLSLIPLLVPHIDGLVQSLIRRYGSDLGADE